MWEATCYLRVLGIEAAAEASLSAVMKAGRFGRFHSQHSTTPHPHLNAGTASVCLPLASSLVHLPTVPPWPLLPLMGKEWQTILQIAFAWQALWKCTAYTQRTEVDWFFFQVMASIRHLHWRLLMFKGKVASTLYLIGKYQIIINKTGFFHYIPLQIISNQLQLN